MNRRDVYQAWLQQNQEVYRQLVDERVRFAVESLKKGDNDSAWKAIEDAIQIQGGAIRIEEGAILNEEGDSLAVVAVTEQLIHFDQPMVATFLSKKSEQPEMNWDPMLWATMAKAYERFGNKDVATSAAKKAECCADAILNETRKLSPVQDNQPTIEQQTAILHLLQAGAYYRDIKQDSKRAIQALRAALSLWPEFFVTQNALGYTLVDVAATPENIDEGLVLTQRAANAHPEFGGVRDSYGWALFRKGDLAGARRALREAADLEPNVAEIHYHLGMVYSKLGLNPDAEIELGRALDLRPDYPEAEKAKQVLGK